MDKELLLIKEILNGDTKAFSEIVERYQSRLYNFVFKMSLSREETEEVLQEAFIKIYNNLYKYNEKYCFSTWAYTITLNTFRSEYKKRKHIKLEKLDESLHYLINSKSPEDILLDKERRFEMFSKVNALSVEHRAALILKYVDELSYKEIGEILKISPDAAKMKVHRAKQILCKQSNAKDGGGF